MSRVVFSGSEAGMGEPMAIQWGDTLKYYVDILNGCRYDKKRYHPGDAYGYVKGLIVFYIAALARRHSDVYFVTVSPGSTRNTSLMDRGQFSPVLGFMIQGFIRMAGQHEVSVGARRYIDAFIEEDYPYSSGSFVCSKKGYTGQVCNAIEVLKKGKVFGEEVKQDLVYEAVRQFMD